MHVCCSGNVKLKYKKENKFGKFNLSFNNYEEFK